MIVLSSIIINFQSLKSPLIISKINFNISCTVSKNIHKILKKIIILFFFLNKTELKCTWESYLHRHTRADEFTFDTSVFSVWRNSWECTAIWDFIMLQKVNRNTREGLGLFQKMKIALTYPIVSETFLLEYWTFQLFFTLRKKQITILLNFAICWAAFTSILFPFFNIIYINGKKNVMMYIL